MTTNQGLDTCFVQETMQDHARNEDILECRFSNKKDRSYSEIYCTEWKWTQPSYTLDETRINQRLPTPLSGSSNLTIPFLSIAQISPGARMEDLMSSGSKTSTICYFSEAAVSLPASVYIRLHVHVEHRTQGYLIVLEHHPVFIE